MKKNSLNFHYDIKDVDLDKALKATPEQVMLWLTRANRLVYLTATVKSKKQTKKYFH